MINPGYFSMNLLFISWRQEVRRYRTPIEAVIRSRWCNIPDHVQHPLPAFAAIDIHLMHGRLMHANYEVVKLACDRYDIRLKPAGKDERACEACFIGKSKKRRRRTPSTPSSRPLQVIHVDTLTHTPIALTGLVYSTTFTNGYTSYRWIVFSRHKSEIPGKILRWINEIERQTDLQVQILHSDQGTEMLEKNRGRDPITSLGINWELTVPDTPE